MRRRTYSPPRTHEQIWRTACRSSADGRPHVSLKLPRPKKLAYRAEGGPAHGNVLWLELGDTARVSMGGQRGRYLCHRVALKGSIGVTKWVPRGLEVVA